MLTLILAVSVLTACGGDSGGGNSSGNGGAAPANTSADKTPGEIRTPDVTVNPGDVIFDNEYIELMYDKFDSELMYIHCIPYGNTTRNLYVYNNAEPLVINGIATDFIDDGFTNMRSSKEGGKIGASDVPILLETRYENALEQAGVALEDLKTVQVTISLVSMDTEETLFEITVLFNIELP